MLSERYKNDQIPSQRLNKLQERMKSQVEHKIQSGIYKFEKSACLICSGNNFELLSEKDRYGLFMPVVICRDCGLIQTNPRMTQESYKQFYSFEYRQLYGGTEKPLDEFFFDQYRRGSSILDFLQTNLNMEIKGKKIFEVGVGAGGILYSFQQKGNDVFGCDIGEDYLEFGRKNYNLPLVHGTLEEIKLPWKPDFIIYSHVIEHILNPFNDLDYLKQFCNPDTYLFIEVPGIKGGLVTNYKKNFLLYLQNAHITHFSLTTLCNLLSKSGLTMIYGDEQIHAIFQISSKKNSKYINDYQSEITLLKKLEFTRFVPTHIFLNTTINILKFTHLYSSVKRIYKKN
jgi:2-polyprenyl-3-methyl-5-hydroxy-6-metoxy-1,4-benzoquinol methylase